MKPTVGSLFAGIGGIDLGLERAGFQTKWQVEIDDYARKVLQRHFPAAERFRDVKQFPPKPDSTWLLHRWKERFSVDILAAGFPCQDISYAGKGAGLKGERSGLFYEVIRIIRVLGPELVLLENVSALLTRGLDQVLGTLASIGYDAEWHCIPAAYVGAPHIRDRVFIVAYSMCKSTWLQKPRDCGQEREYSIASESTVLRQENRTPCSEGIGADSKNVSDTNGQGLQGQRQVTGRIKPKQHYAGYDCRWEAEPAVGRVVNGISNRVDRIRGLGNAVVPQVAEYIGRQIIHSLNRRGDVV